MESVREGARVDDLLRIDAGRRGAGDVANVVGASAARRKSQILQRRQHREGVRGADLADLQIGTRGDVGIAAAMVFGDRGDAPQLLGVEDPIRDAQPAHERVLGRSGIEQAEEFVAENVDALGKPAGRDVGADLVPHVERMALALGLFLRHQRFALGEEAVLRGAMNVARSLGRWLGVRRHGGRHASTFRRKPAHETFEKALLLVAKIRFGTHSFTRANRNCIQAIPDANGCSLWTLCRESAIRAGCKASITSFVLPQYDALRGLADRFLCTQFPRAVRKRSKPDHGASAIPAPRKRHINGMVFAETCRRHCEVSHVYRHCRSVCRVGGDEERVLKRSPLGFLDQLDDGGRLCRARDHPHLQHRSRTPIRPIGG